MIYVQIETDISILVKEDYHFGISCGEYNVYLRGVYGQH